MQYMEPISSILVYAKQDEQFIKSVGYQVVWTKNGIIFLAAHLSKLTSRPNHAQRGCNPTKSSM